MFYEVGAALVVPPVQFGLQSIGGLYNYYANPCVVCICISLYASHITALSGSPYASDIPGLSESNDCNK